MAISPYDERLVVATYAERYWRLLPGIGDSKLGKGTGFREFIFPELQQESSHTYAKETHLRLLEDHQ